MDQYISAFIFLAFYLAPWLIAYQRSHQNQLAIAVLNVLLGWTVIGWIVALIWACTAVQKPVGSGNSNGS